MKGKQNEPIFFDPRNRRWPRVKGLAFLGVFFLALIIALFLVNLFTAARFSILSPSQGLAKSIKNLAGGWSPVRLGFFAYWDKTCLSSLKAHLEQLDGIVGVWLSLADADGTIREDNAADRRTVASYIAAHDPDTKIIAQVSNAVGSAWDSRMLADMLADPQARGRAIGQLLHYARSNHFAGICVDFEDIAEKSLSDYYRFLDELHGRLHAFGLSLLVAVPADDDHLAYSKVAALVDYVVIMAYDEHWANGRPGPIASMDWFTSMLRKRQGDVPAAKMILALGNYAYDWQAGEDREDGRPGNGAKARDETFKDAIYTATWAKSSIVMDPVSLNPMYEYTDGKNKPHQVWMLDAVTFFNEMAAASPMQPYGIALWRLGSEDPSLWKVFTATPQLSARTARQLRSVVYDYGADWVGSGEIVNVVRSATPGQRHLDFDENRGLIIAANYTVFPFPSLISLSGAARHRVALTFDDGPDPVYTPQILDELKKAGVPATFFIIGYNGMKNPSLLRREYAEYHEIGNHTFTHPDIAKISGLRLKAEIKATELLLEKTVGHGTRLFRAPYNTDSEPMTAAELQPLKVINGMGYEDVGLQIDTDDWRLPGAGEIVTRALEEKAAHGGNIILLHDDGGDRAQTVKALPGIIKAFRARGYRFVTVSELTGKSRDAVMPAAPRQSLWTAWGRYLGFDVLNLGQAILTTLFLIGIVLGLSRMAFITVIALIERARCRRPPPSPPRELAVSVIIPAFNEETVIGKTIASLLAARRPAAFEILVVDDGSTDGTYELVRTAYGSEPAVRCFSLPNGGKHAALNYGIAQARGEIIVTLDADTVVAREAIVLLARRFANPAIGAVAGNAKVGNRINLLTRWQALEYVTSQNIDRRALDVLNGITVVPGAIGAWRRAAMEKTGGFSADTLAEDSDLTIQIIKLGYRICYEEEAIASTEAPADIRGFLRQRFRWMFGTFQVAWKHTDALFRPRHGFLGFFSLPNILLHQIFFPLISPVIDLFMLLALLSAAIDRLQHPLTFSPDSLLRILFFYLIFLCADFLAAAIAFAMEKKEDPRLLVWLLPQRFFYRQLLYYVAIKSIVASLRGRLVGWNKVERRGTVTPL